MRATSTEDRPLHRSPESRAPDTRTLIDDYLAEQQRLQTPVRRFSDAHDHQALAPTEPVWRDLIPLTAPKTGEQYAFEVDLDRCTGCKACVAGCHSLNGLDEEETWRDVGLLLGGTRSHPFQQTVTTACHHCEDPGCLNGCPVLAYEKDPLTGIVRHLDDQCIGCQYCVLKCPYDVPKYSERLGIVRKCDMCHNRLSAGEAPACAQACPTQAIRIVTVQTHHSAPDEADAAAHFPPVETKRSYTYPTTRYVTKRSLPENISAADAATLRPQPPHWPLVFMLTLAPMAVGCFTAEALVLGLPSSIALVGWAAAALGLAGSVLHLGQPLRAWRVFLGLRKSWLSREAVIFGAWFGAATVHTLHAARWPSFANSAWFNLLTPNAATVAIVGAIGLVCSVMIYVDTRRHHWRLSQTGPRFFGSAITLGAAVAFAVSPKDEYAAVLALGLLIKVAVETRCLRPLDRDDDSPKPDLQTAQLLTGPLRLQQAGRIVSALAVIFVAATSFAFPLPFAARVGLIGLTLVSEITERYLYFRAVYAPKMPGVVLP